MARELQEETPINQAADRFLGAFRNAMSRSFEAMHSAMNLRELTSASSRQDSSAVHVQISNALAALNRVASQELPPLLERILVAGGTAEARQLLARGFRAAADNSGLDIPLPYRFDRTNPQAQVFIQQHTGELIREISQDAKAAVQSVLSRGFQDRGFPPSQMAKLLRGSVGLTEAQQKSVLALRERIVDNPGKLIRAGGKKIRVPLRGMPADRMDRILSQYQTKLENFRHLSIARTETIRVANEGQTQLWHQQVQKGNLDRSAQRTWIATLGACPICTALDGQTTGLYQSFNGVGSPPAHPRCRCTQALARNVKLRRAPERSEAAPGESLEDIHKRLFPQLYETPKDGAPISQNVKNVRIHGSTAAAQKKGRAAWAKMDAELSRIKAEYTGLRQLDGGAQLRVVNVWQGGYVRGSKSKAYGSYWQIDKRLDIAIGGRNMGGTALKFGEGKWSVSQASNDAMATWRHEFGHHVHLRMMSRDGEIYADRFFSDAQVEWNRIYTDSYLVSHHLPHSIANTVTKYAATNEKELFAESFAIWTHEGYALSARKLPAQIEAFMEKYVGRRVAVSPAVSPIVPPALQNPVMVLPRPTTQVRPISVPKPVGVKLSAADIEDIVRRKAAGESITEISRRYNINPTTTRYHITNWGKSGKPVPGPTVVVAPPISPIPPPQPPVGPLVKNRLTASDVTEIRRRVASGESQAKVAREFGIHPSYLSSIVRRIVWKDVA